MKKLDSSEQKNDEKLGDFFAKSPLKSIALERKHETYEQRVKF